jgi:hypothetical protein
MRTRSTPRFPPGTHDAAQDVTAYALASLAPAWQRWYADLNLEVAQWAWNAHIPAMCPPKALAELIARTDPGLWDLYTAMLRERTEHYARWRFALRDLSVRTRPGPNGREMVFFFRIDHCDGGLFQPCEMAVDVPPDAAP